MDEYLEKLATFHAAIKPGDLVLDTLTKTNCKVVSLSHDEYGNRAIWVESDYLDGGRFPWEIDQPTET